MDSTLCWIAAVMQLVMMIVVRLTPASCSDRRILSHAWGLVGLKPPALTLSRPAGSASATTLVRTLPCKLLMLVLKL
jgi:hypothetical protein